MSHIFAVVPHSQGRCELSDIEMRDLKPNQNFALDKKFLLFSWDFDEAHCFGGSPPGFGRPFTPTNRRKPQMCRNEGHFYCHSLVCLFVRDVNCKSFTYIAPSAVPGKPELTWMRFTVNGQPCRSGSYCTQNINKDIWSCPVEHGDWDYCCRPDHKCGYSEGTSYPW